ncbi:neuron navigator 3-like, partial [Limulus polyphemus]|uniref:Neuron navigator 3-like n=1 Tax=Limulus polyphemus TaxID=6850 RepID=A0ABM1B521_LIMPO
MSLGVRYPVCGNGRIVPKAPSGGNAISNSPHVSFIPQPQSGTVRRDRNSADKSKSRPLSVSSIRHLPVKIRSGATLRNTSPDVHPVGHKYTSSNNNSMLDKFSFFNYKVTPGEKAKGGGFSKRTSSSSGFSSARSERSDSSNSDPSSGSTPERPEASIYLTSPSVDSTKVNANSFSKNTFGRNLPRSKSSETKTINYKTVTKKPASLNSTSSNVTNSAAPLEENLEKKGNSTQNEKSHQSVNIKKLEQTKSGIQKLKPKLNIQVSKSLPKEPTTQKNKCISNRKPSTTQKVKLKSTEPTLVTERTKNVECVNEKDQPKQNTNSVSENKNHKYFTLCMFEDLSCDPGLRKANSKYSGEIDSCESSNANIESSNLCAKIMITAGAKSQETRNLEENQLVENKQNSVHHLRLDTLIRKSENVLKTIRPEIPSVPETNYLNSSETMSNQVVNSNIPKPTAAVKGVFKHSKDIQDFKSSSDTIYDEKEWKQNIKSRNTFNLLGSLNIPLNSSNGENQRDLQTTNHRQINKDLGATCQKSDINSNVKLGLAESERYVDGPQISVSVAKVLPIMNRESSKTNLRKLNTVSCHTENKLIRKDLGPLRKAESQENEDQFCQMSRYPLVTQQIKTLEGISDAEYFNQVKETPYVMKKCELYDSCATGLLSRDMAVIEESDDVMLNIKPMPPLTRASPYGYMRGHLSSSRNLTNRLYMANFPLQTDVRNTDDGRRPLSQHRLTTDDSSKIYGVPVKRALGNSRALLDVSCFPDIDSTNIVIGYMSDGEVIGQSPLYRVEDISSGYTSESGRFLYSRQPTRKISEKKLTLKDANVLQDDSFDDDSSINSKLSDNIVDVNSDDNMTELSISTEANHNGSSKRMPRDIETKNPLAAWGENKRHYDEHVLGVPSTGKPAAGRSTNIKKTDSSMQTECKAFHQMSSAVWKNYLQHQRNSGFESGQMKEKNTISTSSASETGKNNEVACGAFDKLNGSHKDKYKRQMQIPEHQKCPDGDVEVEKGNERSSNPKSTKFNSNLINQPIKPSVESQEPQGSRTIVVTGSETNNEETLTSTDFAYDNNRICNSKSKSSSSKDMSLDTMSNDDCNLNFSDINYIQSSNLSRNVTMASSCGGRNSYKRKESIKLVANTQTNMDENYVFDETTAHSDSEYSSLGRKTSKQNPLTPTGIKGFHKCSYGTRSVFSRSSNPKSNYVILSDFPPISKERSVNRSRLSVPVRPNSTDIVNCANTDPLMYINNYVPSSKSYAWLCYSGSSSASFISGSGARSFSGSGLTEAESMESLSSISSSVHAQVQNVRATSLTHARLTLHQRELSDSPHLTRSSSIRSTKSEKLYPSMLQRSGEVNNAVSVYTSVGGHAIGENTNDQPTLPTNLNKQGASRNLFPISPVNPLPQTSTRSVITSSVPISGSVPQCMGGLLSRLGNKTDEIHGSSLSVVSSTSSMFSTTEDKQSQEIKKLKRELEQANEKVAALTSQLTTNAHMVAAFEQSLSNMTNRLHHLTASAEQKYLWERSCLIFFIADIYFTRTTNFQDGKHATISVLLGSHGDYSSFKAHNENISEVLIGAFLVNSKMSWDLIDNIVKQTFKEYVQRIDPLSSLGLSTESILSYQVGEIVREKESEKPELLPCGYLVGNNMQVQVILKGTSQNSVDGLSFETLIAKSIIQRYVSLLLEHRRIILCGPSGTGKTYLAQKLAEHLVLRNVKEVSPGAIAIFGVDHKSAEELRQYLSTVAEQCERSNPCDLPTVIILDNLHYVGSLSEVFNGFLSAKYQKCPYIIGTMNQATCSTTNLQLHHNFRWVLCANHREPVKGFLGRYLRRKLVEHEIQSNSNNPELTKIIEWMPKIWEHLNNFLETHSSSDVTIGPKLFLSCPLDVVSSQVWFTDLWNYGIIPYIMEAVREGLQLYGRRAPWDDPADWVFKNYPWPTSRERKCSQLLHLQPEDVGYEHCSTPGATAEGQQGSSSDVEADPL